MKEGEFWAVLVQDYAQTAHRLPTLTANKIRGGVPVFLRGVVWPSIARACDPLLHAEYHKLADRPSPYDALIGKDIGRSFPKVDMFREKDGEGQKMLGRVLKAFSLYDEKIGYCQGLGFVVGPLLMYMSEPEAFAILVKYVKYPKSLVQRQTNHCTDSWKIMTFAPAIYLIYRASIYESINFNNSCRDTSPNWPSISKA